MTKKICHITTVHPRFDTRIFIKQCISLSKHYQVNLIVADGMGDETKDGVIFHDIGLRQKARIKRAKIDSEKALKKALELNCEVYHLHDPELSRIGIKLKKAGKKVIYDAHEDLPRQIYGKPYLKNWMKPLLSKFIEWQENKSVKQFDYIITATTHIKNRFLKINPHSIDINNYPIIGELKNNTEWKSRNNKICYIGAIDKVRGIYEMVDSLKYTNAKLLLGGKFSSIGLENKIKLKKHWVDVEYKGFIDREKVSEVLSNSKAGLVTLHPIINYLDALPVKMFEYMMAGLPVITSNIPLWKDIIETTKSGIAVNPLNPKEIGEAINYLINNPEEAEQMGKNGQKAVKEKYNWEIEEKKLIAVYKEILE